MGLLRQLFWMSSYCIMGLDPEGPWCAPTTTLVLLIHISMLLTWSIPSGLASPLCCCGVSRNPGRSGIIICMVPIGKVYPKCALPLLLIFLKNIPSYCFPISNLLETFLIHLYAFWLCSWKFLAFLNLVLPTVTCPTPKRESIIVYQNILDG